MKKIVLFTFLFLTSFFCRAQVFKDIGNPFFGEINYRVPVNKNKINNSGEGLGAELNIGFVHESILSIYGGWAFQGKFWPSKFNSEFATDYANDLQLNGRAGIDSAGLTVLKEDMRTMHSIAPPFFYHDGFHESSFYFGICFKSPNKKIPMVKIYHGVNRGVGTSESATIVYSPCASGGYTNDGANHFFMRPLVWGVNVCFRNPFWFLNVVKKDNFENLKNATLSFYYEENDFSQTRYFFINGCAQQSSKMKLADFMTADFNQKYKYDVRFGFKIGFLIIDER
jgi:hypothetical protein